MAGFGGREKIVGKCNHIIISQTKRNNENFQKIHMICYRNICYNCDPMVNEIVEVPVVSFPFSPPQRKKSLISKLRTVGLGGELQAEVSRRSLKLHIFSSPQLYVAGRSCNLDTHKEINCEVAPKALHPCLFNDPCHQPPLSALALLWAVLI